MIKLTWHYGEGEQMTTQIVYPIADISNAGAWVPSSGSVVYAVINDGSNSTYVESDNNPGASDTFEVRLDNLETPQAGAHTYSFRANRRSGGRTATLRVDLYQGTTLIRQGSARTLDGTITTYTETLTSGQADSITDWTNLRLRFVPGTSGEGAANRLGVYHVEKEVPLSEPRTLTITKSGNGGIKVNGEIITYPYSEDFDMNEIVEIEAVPDANHKAVWDDAGITYEDFEKNIPDSGVNSGGLSNTALIGNLLVFDKIKITDVSFFFRAGPGYENGLVQLLIIRKNDGMVMATSEKVELDSLNLPFSPDPYEEKNFVIPGCPVLDGSYYVVLKSFVNLDAVFFMWRSTIVGGVRVTTHTFTEITDQLFQSTIKGVYYGDKKQLKMIGNTSIAIEFMAKSNHALSIGSTNTDDVLLNNSSIITPYSENHYEGENVNISPIFNKYGKRIDAFNVGTLSNYHDDKNRCFNTVYASSGLYLSTRNKPGFKMRLKNTEIFEVRLYVRCISAAEEYNLSPVATCQVISCNTLEVLAESRPIDLNNVNAQSSTYIYTYFTSCPVINEDVYIVLNTPMLFFRVLCYMEESDTPLVHLGPVDGIPANITMYENMTFSEDYSRTPWYRVMGVEHTPYVEFEINGDENIQIDVEDIPIYDLTVNKGFDGDVLVNHATVSFPFQESYQDETQIIVTAIPDIEDQEVYWSGTTFQPYDYYKNIFYLDTDDSIYLNGYFSGTELHINNFVIDFISLSMAHNSAHPLISDNFRAEILKFDNKDVIAHSNYVHTIDVLAPSRSSIIFKINDCPIINETVLIGVRRDTHEHSYGVMTNSDGIYANYVSHVINPIWEWETYDGALRMSVWGHHPDHEYTKVFNISGTTVLYINDTQTGFVTISPVQSTLNLEGYPSAISILIDQIIIERRVGEGEWEVLDTISVNETSYKDSISLVKDELYSYRIKVIHEGITQTPRVLSVKEVLTDAPSSILLEWSEE